jgi:hypothetical protein
MTTPSVQPAAGSAGPPAAREISALIAWMRRLSDTGPHRAGPAELAAFQHAKRDLLARIERHSHPRPPLTTSQETFVD